MFYVHDLTTELGRFNLLPGDPTNILSVSVLAGELQIETWSPLENELADTRKEVEELEKEVKELETANVELEAQLELAKDTMEALEDGKTPLDYQKETQEAERQMREWRQLYKEAQEELEALRKRKGVVAGLFKNTGAVMSYLYSAKDEAAKALLAKIQT